MNLVLDRLVLRTSSKKESPWTLDLSPGTHAVRLPDGVVAADLGRVVAGLERPKRGRVLLGQEDPGATPALRARIGCTSGLDWSTHAHASAKSFWEMAGALRAKHGGVTNEPIGLLPSERFETAIGQLSPQELTDFELELALGIENPHLVWLSQPPRLTAEVALVLERLRQRAASGAVVVVTVSTLREAQLWGDQQHGLRPASGAGSTYTIQLVVERPREIAAELQASTAVLRTVLDPARPKLVLVSGTDELALRQACARAVVARRCELWEMASLRGATK